MMKADISKATRLGKTAVFGAGAIFILAALFGTFSMAFAANGKPFLLGRNNAASAVSTLVKQGPGPALRLLVRPGQPPMSVNSSVRVANLNADKVDGRDAGAFLGANGTATNSDRLDGEDSSAFLASDGKAADSETLDGLDSTEFQQSGAAAGGDLSGNYPNPDIATDAVGSNEVSTNAVGSDEIGPDAVGSGEIATSAVGSDEISENGVGSSEIIVDGVGSSEIATGAVGSSEIGTDAVGTNEIFANAVGSDEIGPGQVGSDEVLDGSMRLGDATFVSRVIQFNPPNLPLGCSNLTVNFTEVEPNDIAWVVPSNSLNSSLTIHSLIQNSTTNVQFRMCNDSSSSVDDVEQPFRITLFRP